MSAFDLAKLRRLSELHTETGDGHHYACFANYFHTHRDAIIARLEAADALAEQVEVLQ